MPRGFNGKYTVRVSNIWSDPMQPVTRLTLECITHEGTPQEKKETRNLKPGASNPPTVVTLTKGRRKVFLPYVDSHTVAVEAIVESMKNAKAKEKNKPARAKAGDPAKAAPGAVQAKGKAGAATE